MFPQPEGKGNVNIDGSSVRPIHALLIERLQARVARAAAVFAVVGLFVTIAHAWLDSGIKYR